MKKMPEINSEKFPSINNIKVDISGVEKLLKNLETKKASGPDQLSNIVLKECFNELAPIISHIFQLSLDNGTLPEDWRNANISPIFDKGDRHTAANYRPVSLTYVCCKMLEHIICCHIMNHLEQYNILTNLQHGFRSGHSCTINYNFIVNRFKRAGYSLDIMGQTACLVLTQSWLKAMLHSLVARRWFRPQTH